MADADAPVPERLLDAALEVAAMHGLNRLSVGDVAKRAGLSRPTLYRAFPGGKQHLFVAMGLRELAAYRQGVVEAVDSADDLGDGWRYQVLRIHSRFARTFDVRAYPFDDQALTIAFEDNNSTIDELVYVADAGTTAVDPGLSVDGWRIDHISADVSERAYPTNWGDPRRPAGADRYAQFRYTIHITRPVLAHLVTTIVPICIVMLIALVAFLIDPKYFAERVGLATTCLISAVALQLTAQNDLPTTSYLVLLDHVYNLAYLTIFLTLALTVVAVRLIDRDARPRAMRLNRIGQAVSVALFFGGTALLIALRA